MTLGWQKFTDPATEREFHYHVASHTSQWLDPPHDATPVCRARREGLLIFGRSGPRSCGRGGTMGDLVAGWPRRRFAPAPAPAPAPSERTADAEAVAVRTPSRRRRRRPRAPRRPSRRGRARRRQIRALRRRSESSDGRGHAAHKNVMYKTRTRLHARSPLLLLLPQRPSRGPSRACRTSAGRSRSSASSASNGVSTTGFLRTSRTFERTRRTFMVGDQFGKKTSGQTSRWRVGKSCPS